MNILTVYAHANTKSFCHTVLEQFTKGLADTGHSNEVLDLYASGLSLVFTAKDYVYWFPDENTPDVVEKAMKRLAGEADLLQRIISWAMFRNKSALEILTSLRKRGPRDVRQQQEKVAKAQALVFISAVWFVAFPPYSMAGPSAYLPSGLTSH